MVKNIKGARCLRVLSRSWDLCHRASTRTSRYCPHSRILSVLPSRNGLKRKEKANKFSQWEQESKRGEVFVLSNAGNRTLLYMPYRYRYYGNIIVLEPSHPIAIKTQLLLSTSARSYPSWSTHALFGTLISKRTNCCLSLCNFLPLEWQPAHGHLTLKV